MATIDKAAIGFSIAIVVVGVAFAMYGEATQSNTTTLAPVAPIERPTPVMDEPVMDEPVMDEPYMDTDKSMGTADETTDEKYRDDTEKGKMMGEKMALVIMFGAGTETIEVFTSSELSDEETTCESDDELGISGHCIPYYIKGATVTSASVNMDDNSVVITIDATDDGYLKAIKSKEGTDSIQMILIDGEETDDYQIMTKSEMAEKMDKQKDKDMQEDKKEMTDKPEERSMDEMTDKSAEEPRTVIVDMPAGTAVIGCEVDDACYIPSKVSINVGDTVSWINSDTAAHTVTSGTIESGPNAIFDSSLVMSSMSFEHTFEEAGTYEYFCIVHPWMVGAITVN